MLLTLFIAFILVAISLALLALGWLVSGKSKIRGGSCGRNPHQKQSDCQEDQSCSLCEHKKDV